ncbi:MAG: type II secretion system protein [Fimbriiglobus sp.]
MHTYQARKAYTLLELLVVMAILAIMAGLLMSAIQKVRIAASKLKSSNNLRQLYLGLELASDSYGDFAGCHPYPFAASVTTLNSINFDKAICPVDLAGIYSLGAPHSVELLNSVDSPTGSYYHRLPILISPADTTLDFGQANPDDRLRCSYSYNFQAFARILPSELKTSDGRSNTIFFAERGFSTNGNPGGPTYYPLNWSQVPPHISSLNSQPIYEGNRRNTFCDPAWGDVVPVVSGTPSVAQPSRPVAPFQVSPKYEEADRHRLRTFYSSGLLVCMGDGSVRTIGPNIESSSFWGVITPNGGEVANLD